MDIRMIQPGIGDPELNRLLDNILDAVLALKARLADSNRDSNSLGGISNSCGFSLKLLSSPITAIERLSPLSV